MDFALEDVDREVLYDRIEVLEELDQREDEYDALVWARDMFYALDEGFITTTGDGHYFSAENFVCPDHFE